MSPDPHALPSDVSRYRIQERLASDSVSDVYRAFDPMIERTVAVKVFPIGGASGDARARLTETFYGAVQRTGALTHSGIASLYDAGELPDAMFLAREFVDGGTLAEWIAATPDADLALRASLFTQIANALEYAHRLGVPHLNLKPTNVLVSGDVVVKIAGFGVAPLVDAISAASSTPVLASGYAAPERLSGGHGDARTDVYGLAIVARDLFTGAISGGASRTPEPPAALDAAAHSRWHDVFSRALAADPAARYHSVLLLKDEVLLMLGVGEAEALLAWETMHEAGRETSRPAEESETILAETSAPARPPAPSAPAPADRDLDNSDAETMLTPPPDSGTLSGLRAREDTTRTGANGTSTTASGTAKDPDRS